MGRAFELSAHSDGDDPTASLTHTSHMKFSHSDNALARNNRIAGTARPAGRQPLVPDPSPGRPLQVLSDRVFARPPTDAGAWLRDRGGEGPRSDFDILLPTAGVERHLTALYHVCASLADGLDEDFLIRQTLKLLREVFDACEAHYYAADRRLAFRVGEHGDRAAVKFAPYLCEQVQRLSHATTISGQSVRRLQERTGRFNYLVCPLRAPGDETPDVPFFVFARPAEWNDFASPDHLLLQAVGQMWVRGLARTKQLAQLRRENETLRDRAGCGAPQLLGSGPALQRLREQARKLAGSKAGIMISGETGSGKELVAQLVHQASPRSGRPFIKVNCAAIPAGLIESELFGHVRGAFTDAKLSREGRFQEADGGTLFLDEVGEMPLAVQSKLLRALESGEIEKVGARGVTRVDVRIVAATHRNLLAMVKSGEFREDLYYRLNVLCLRVPPLREHPEDIHDIVADLAHRFCQETGIGELSFSAEALEVMRLHSWPGNVRELRNVVQRCCSLCDSAAIGAELVREQIDALSGA